MSLLPVSDDDILPDDPFILGGSVGHTGENDRADVIKAQVLFGNTGHYDLAALGAPTGWPGGSLEQAMRRFQKERGLQVDGLMLPQGETLQALRDELGDSLKGYRVPGPQDVDRYYAERSRHGGDDAGRAPGTIVTAAEGDGAPLGVLRSVSDMLHAPPLRRMETQWAQAQSVDTPTRAGSKSEPAQILVPPHKTAIFARKENQGAADGFDREVEKLIPSGTNQHDALLHLYIEEGGRVADPASGAVGGILPGTLDDMRARDWLPDLPSGLGPRDLSPGQQAYVYRAYFDDVLKPVGGAQALEKLNAELARALADSLFLDGRAVGTGFLQEALKRSGANVVVDGKMGPQTFAAFETMGRDPETRDRLLRHIVDARIDGKQRSAGEIARIQRLLPVAQRKQH